MVILGLQLTKVSSYRFLPRNNTIRYIRYRDPTLHPNWQLVNDQKCGQSVSESRIIGGTDADLGQFPWLVQIYTAAKGMAPTFDCGGSIINSKYLITAGHCFNDFISISFIRVGDFDTSTNPDCDDYAGVCAPPYRDYHAEKIIKHENFGKPEYLQNDITLIRIKENFKFNDFVRPICLPYGSELKRQYYPGNVLEVAGWGANRQIQTKSGIVNKPAVILQKLKMPVVDSKSCEKAIKLPINDKQLCAGGFEGYDACAGDSGGPLMKYTTMNNNSFRYYLIGIVSYGPTVCAQKSVPGVYTRIDKHLNWILDHIY